MSNIKVHPIVASADDFQVVSIADYVKKLSSNLSSKHSYFAFMFIQKGQGIFEIDFNKYPIVSRNVVFINYGEYRNILADGNLEGWAVLFSKEYYNLIYTGNPKIKSDKIFHQMNHVIRLDSVYFNQIINLLEWIKLESRNNLTYRDEIICLVLKIIALVFYRDTLLSPRQYNKSNRHIEIIDQFNSAIDVYYKIWKLPAKYSKLLFVSPSYLNVLSKKRFGISAGQLIKNRIILEAKRLLNHTTLSVEEIGFELGFEYKSHFNKYFKLQTGLPPEKFRNQNR